MGSVFADLGNGLYIDQASNVSNQLGSLPNLNTIYSAPQGSTVPTLWTAGDLSAVGGLGEAPTNSGGLLTQDTSELGDLAATLGSGPAAVANGIPTFSVTGYSTPLSSNPVTSSPTSGLGSILGQAGSFLGGPITAAGSGNLFGGNLLGGISYGRIGAFLLGLILIAGGIYLFKPAQTIINTTLKSGAKTGALASVAA